VIKQIATCPYCGQGQIAYDCQAMEVTFNPDTLKQEPCCHLICLQGIYCLGELLPNGSRRVGVAKVEWQHPAFPMYSLDQLAGNVQNLPPATEDWSSADPEPPFQVNTIDLAMDRRLSQREMVRWLDQVGWTKASEDQIPHEEHRWRGKVVFALRCEDLLSLLMAGGQS
jgi:hypothetical protein